MAWNRFVKKQRFDATGDVEEFRVGNRHIENAGA
jgi:hypothetical protein